MRRSRLSLLWTLTALVLAVSGAAQMPIFKRYYIADIPGLGWLAQYYLTHTVHYAAAGVFLALAGWWAGRFAFARGWRFTPTGRLRFWAVLAVIGTGVIRVLKNSPDVWYDPMTVLVVDWAHLGAALVLGVLALVAARRKEPYVARVGRGGR
ncbi:FeS-binding protein [Desulfocurvus sp. DL9XJH121]